MSRRVTTYPDESVLAVLRAPTRAAALDVAESLGVPRSLALDWFYHGQRRAVRLAHQHRLPRPPARPQRGRTFTLGWDRD